MGKEIYVYENWSGTEPVFIGTLSAEQQRGKESYSFQYDDAWLKQSALGAPLDPELEYYYGRQYSQRGAGDLFGMFLDSCPDRWGRTLIRRAEGRQAKTEGRMPRVLFESDYLLGLYDTTRLGALRFKTEKDGPFLNYGYSGDAVPPLTRIRELEAASIRISSNDDRETDKNLALLLAPGSSLGGARPKANVSDEQGNLWIAKFPTASDDFDTEAWEMTAMQLAADCGINTSPVRLMRLSDSGATFLTRRFDRNGMQRIHFASAMTMLMRKDRDTEDASYLDIVDFLRMYGAAPGADFAELWKRIVFSMLISNTDDHLRNHGFLMGRNGWRLSPVYDINPDPSATSLSLTVDGFDSDLDPGLALDAAEYYGVAPTAAKEYIEQTASMLRRKWRYYAEKNGIHRSEINLMQPAFRLAELLGI